MKKLIALSIIFILTSFSQPKPKTYTLNVSAQEAQLIYDALGELPAKVSEGIRMKIAQQITEQSKEVQK